MSDATLPPLASSSASAESQDAGISEASATQQDVFAFLVHSQASVTNGEPPEVDNGKLARPKRRRTSPEDQATLEAEYICNPKPDKAARLEIVKRVSLGEKEVQIWFQNRRQNTRRKSRPLLPHEIAAFGLGGMAALSSDPITGYSSASTSDLPPSSSPAGVPTAIQQGSDPIQDDDASKTDPASTEESVKTTTGGSPSVDVAHRLDDCQQSSTLASIDKGIVSLPQVPGFSLPTNLGYLSNRRNAPSNSFSTPPSSYVPVSTTPTSLTPPPPSSCPESLLRTDPSGPSSQMRLSMSLDGKAELVSAEASPPRPEPPRPASSNSSIPGRRLGALQRSYSALPFGSFPRTSSFSSVPFIPRISSGRSRDARTWEFCCDADARDELTTQAENESNGSAVAAISLLRSTSNSALKPNVNKRNAPAPKDDPTKHDKKRKLGRAQSSLARLQSTGKAMLTAPEAWPHKPKASNTELTSPLGDSDKENWIPRGENGGNAQRRRPLPSGPHPPKQNSRRVLGDSVTLAHPAAASSRRAGATRRRLPEGDAEIFEDEAVEEGQEQVAVVDKEVQRFMTGDISPSKKGDLDCIQGLLSLSQGNWR
ncbi:MAG: hypothetical protein M1818_008157 [Claussenomyces sp. TS43310]|nr:MAG: hypothetical protein M1818_008157 [Claussenomyces sp. TS43310]